MKRSYPQINVVSDQRVVDNGKILTTAGLSASIDGALHMVSVLEGEDVAKTVALILEYNWQPDNAYIRGAMADQLIPDLDLTGVADLADMRLDGDKDRWNTSLWFNTKLPAEEFNSAVRRAYQKAYSEDGPWSPGSFHIDPKGPLAADLHFDDLKGGHWKGTLTVAALPDGQHRFVVKIATQRVSPG
jgi:hypothetical protein